MKPILFDYLFLMRQWQSGPLHLISNQDHRGFESHLTHQFKVSEWLRLTTEKLTRMTLAKLIETGRLVLAMS